MVAEARRRLRRQTPSSPTIRHPRIRRMEGPESRPRLRDGSPACLGLIGGVANAAALDAFTERST